VSTDLRHALRDAVAGAPEDTVDLDAVVATGSRRVRRRRRVLAAAASALGVAAAVVALLVVPGPGRDESEPVPADVVRLELDSAQRLDLDVLASRRTVTNPDEDLSFDRFEGLTPDGLVLRAEYAFADDDYRVGLLDPATGRTDWLPPPPGDVGEPQVAGLTTDRVVLLDNREFRSRALLVLDRATRTWTRSFIRLPGGIEAHVPPQLRLGPDDRLYVGNNLEGSARMHWWSFPVPAGGDPRPEPRLAGSAVAWDQDVQVTADPRGRVVRTVAGATRILSDGRPASCPAPEQSFRPDLALAGDRPVVSYWCGDGHVPATLTVVPDRSGRPAVEVPGIVLAADQDRVLLSGSVGRSGGLYLLDLDRPAARRISGPLSDTYPDNMAQVGLAAGLVLWNTAGPTDDRDTHDVVWQVARLP
jgi:hypothetical protein